MAGVTWNECPRTAPGSLKPAANPVTPTYWGQTNAVDAVGSGWSHASLAWHPADAPANAAAPGVAAPAAKPTEPPTSVSAAADCLDPLSATKCKANLPR